MNNIHKKRMYSLCIVSIDIHRIIVYNLITVKGREVTGKEVAI